MELIRTRKKQNIKDDDIHTELSILPDQVKSLFTSVKTDANTSMSLDRSSFNFKYRMIMCVSYLAGFETSSQNGVMITSPIFKRLTRNVLDASAGSALICRLVPWNNTHFGIVPVRGLGLGVFHETFVIRNGNRPGGRTTGTTTAPVQMRGTQGGMTGGGGAY